MSPARPRPILKIHPSEPKPTVQHPQVHFPPWPSLARTFSAHSSASYDRSPIIVSPNSCALPERGCPGRTYYDHDTQTTMHDPPRSPSRQTTLQHTGKSIHPRAAHFQHPISVFPESPESVKRCSTPRSSFTPKAVPSYTTFEPPALVHDFSSESDESDGSIPTPPDSLSPYPSHHHSFPTDGRHDFAKFFSFNTPSSDAHPPPYAPPNYDPPPEGKRRRHRKHHLDRSKGSNSVIPRSSSEELAEEEQEDEGEGDLPDIRGLSLSSSSHRRQESYTFFSSVSMPSSGFSWSGGAGCLDGF
jgi:hypothetical protein